jgi:hypothetical protein
MDISFTQKVSTPEDVLFRELAGESVLLNLDNENYYGLDEVGTHMWEVLIASASIQAAYEKLLAEYDVAPDVLQQDMVELVENLLENGLMELSEG